MGFLPILLPYCMLLLLFLRFSLSSPSLTCTSQNFTNNKLYKNCTDLPSLKSYLHWTYDSSKSSLSIAFLAPPPKPDGWIAWAINPTGTGMPGAQSLIAFKQSDGSMAVKTFNISSYSSIVPSKLSFDVSDSSAEYSDGLMKIFATLALPENITVLNQVWQVGGSVTGGGMPAKHDFDAANLNARGTLELMKTQNNNGTSPGAGGSNSSGNSTSGNQSSNDSGDPRIRATKVGLYVILLFFAGMLAF